MKQILQQISATNFSGKHADLISPSKSTKSFDLIKNTNIERNEREVANSWEWGSIIGSLNQTKFPNLDSKTNDTIKNIIDKIWKPIEIF